MYTSLVEFLAVLLFAGCFWHASQYEGRDWAQRWFVSAYLAALIRETINQLTIRTYVFAPSVLRFGAAPALVTILWVSLFYIAFHFARRFVAGDKPGWLALLILLVTASLALPIEATAAQLQWWLYSTATLRFFGGLPIAAPFVWGGSAAIFYAVFWRIERSRLPDRGKLYALITLSPVIAVAQLLLVMLLNA